MNRTIKYIDGTKKHLIYSPLAKCSIIGGNIKCFRVATPPVSPSLDDLHMNSGDDHLNHNNKADIEICQCHIFFKQVNRVICIIY